MCDFKTALAMLAIYVTISNKNRSQNVHMTFTLTFYLLTMVLLSLSVAVCKMITDGLPTIKSLKLKTEVEDVDDLDENWQGRTYFVDMHVSDR